MVTSGEREGERGNIGVGEKRVIMGIYEITCVKLLKTRQLLFYDDKCCASPSPRVLSL